MTALIKDPKILLVCDDHDTGRIWTHALSQRGIEVVLAESAEVGLRRWGEGACDLIVIDVHTPQLDGIGLCGQLRAEAINPILLFTSLRGESYMLQAYQAGVDECIIGPVSPALFLAKVKAWLRRSWTITAEAVEIMQVGDLRLDPGRREVAGPTGPPVKLTNLEFRLLHLLMSHAGHTLETDVLIDRVWGYASSGDSVLLKNLVYRVRRKIEPDPNQPRYIQTAAGEGYVLRP